MKSELPIPASARLVGRLEGARCRLEHRYNLMQQRFKKPALGIAGGYHYGNLGDMALGHAVKRQATRLQVSSELQTVYNLSQWPKVPSVVVGGGAVAYRGPMEQLRRNYGHIPERVAILGVDFNEPAAVEASRDFLSKVNMITCRSSTQAEWLKQELGRPDVGWHYDLCFSYFDDAVTQSSGRQPILGINLIPFFYLMKGSSLRPGTGYTEEISRYQPELLPHIDTIGERYRLTVRAIVQEAQKAGLQVVHFPYTPMDDVFARTILGDLNVKFRPYLSNPQATFTAMRQCQRFFTTRFHSLIFAMLTETPLVAFTYATKCERLLADMEMPEESKIAILDLLGDPAALAEKVVHGPAATVPRARLEAVGGEVAATIQRAVQQTTAGAAP